MLRLRPNNRGRKAVVALLCLVGLLLQAMPAFAKKEHPAPTLRWAEGQPGCTFSRDKDGKYRYALWTDDYGIILAVDSQELQLLHKRVQPYFAVHLTLLHRGKAKLTNEPQTATPEFVKHFKLVKPALNL